MQNSLNEKEWRDLLEDVDAGTVVPVIGQALITISAVNGDQQPLYTALAPRLATELGLPDPENYTSTSQVAAAHVLSGQERSRVYRELRTLLRNIEAATESSSSGRTLDCMASTAL